MAASVIPDIQDSTYITDFTSALSPIQKRAVHILDDGSLVAVIPQQNATNSPYGSKDNVNKVEIWYSPASRATWTKKATYTIPAAHDVPATSYFHCGSVLLNDGSVYFAWVDVGQTGVYACVFTKTASATWSTPASFETVFIPDTRYPFRLDLDVNRANNRVFIGWLYRGVNSATDTIGADVIARLGVNNYDFIHGAFDLGGDAQQKSGTEDFTLAIDSSSTVDYTRIIYCVTVVSQVKDYGDMIIWRVVKNSDNSDVGPGGIYQVINAGRAASRRSNWLWATAPGTWTLVGLGGSGSGSEAWACRFEILSSIDAPFPAFKQISALRYSPLKFSINRSNSVYSDVTATYANDKFNVYFHSSTAVYNLPGKFITPPGPFGVMSSVSFGSVTSAWDNVRVYDQDAARGDGVASGLYGGARNTDATNMHDVVMSYFSRTAISTSDAGWFHQWNQPSIAPANVTPAENSLQGTSLPVLGIYADLDQDRPRSPIRPKWQIAKDAGFTQNLIEHIKATETIVLHTNVVNSYVFITDQLPLDKALSSGSWYIRAAQLDSWDTQGAWSAAQQFSVSHPPYATPVSPAGGATFQYGNDGQITFTWKFGDGYQYDTQTAYRILIELNDDDGTSVLDTGKVESSDAFATISVPDTAKNQQLRWRVQLWDVDDSMGELSTFSLFMVADPPTLTINTPVSGAVVDNARPIVEWVYTDPAGSVQQAYRVVFLQDGNAIFDSGWQSGSESVFQGDQILFQNESAYTVILYAQNITGLTVSAASSFTTEWDQPASPDLSSLFIDTTYYDKPDSGYVLISWNNQAADPDFLSWKLYRRVQLPQTPSLEDTGIDWELIYEEFSVSPPLDAPAYVYRDYTAPSSYEVHYTLTQTVMRFGSVVESQHVSIADVGKIIMPYSGAYWLIDPDADGDPDDVVRLPGASADSYKDEYETEEMFIIGRGRHVEIGDRHGYNGTLSIPLRFISGSNALDGPRRQKLDLERFKAKRKAVYIRTPFGDIFLANTGDLSFERIAGVGSSEFTNVSLPYSEVFK